MADSLGANERRSPTDLERAVAILAVDHSLIDVHTAASLIRDSRLGRVELAQAVRNLVDDVSLMKAVASEFDYRFLDLHATGAGFGVDTGIIEEADLSRLKRYGALPLRDDSGRSLVAVSDVANIDATGYLDRLYGDRAFTVVLASEQQIQSKLALQSTGLDSSLEAELGARTTAVRGGPASTANTAQSPLITWVDKVLESAVAQGVSDVHMSINMDGSMLLRFRVDGSLRRQNPPPAGYEREVLGIVMTKAGLDSADYMRAQSGTFSMFTSGRQVDTRVEMLPQSNGPTIVIRILDSANVQRRLDDMGFDPEHLRLMRRAVSSPQGMVMMCGPTGSGKTTTLYALIREVASMEKHTVTVEDPVEYRLPLVNQTQIRSSGNRPLTFANALRSILRLDPDNILIGEIRDDETAEIAMKAAITGHLVLSTVHANTAIGVYSRLIQMGVPPYIVADAITLNISQRLVPRLHSCARIGAPTPDEAAAFERVGAEVPDQVAQPVGCGGCDGKGFAGRLPVLEVLAPTPALKALVRDGAPTHEIEAQAHRDGFAPMLGDALRLVHEGHTTITAAIQVIEVAL